MRTTIFATALAMCVAVVAPAWAQQHPETGGPEVWDFSNPAVPRHWFTGLTCRPEELDLPLTRRMAFEPTGGDVGCFYSSPDSDDYVTVYATNRWEHGSPLQVHVDQTWSEVRGRYEGATELAEGERTIDTPAGPLVVRELVLQVRGRDAMRAAGMSGLTGAWLADVGGWTLKVRLTGSRSRNLRWMREHADTVLGRAAGEMNVARECAGVGTQNPSRTQIDPEDTAPLTLMATVLSMNLREAVPRDIPSARAAGYVCLGMGVRTNGGHYTAAVMQRTAAAPGAHGMRLLALGEIRNTPGSPMIAVFDLDANELLDAPDSGDGRVHVVYAFGDGQIGYLGTATDPPRESAAYGAANAADGEGAAARVDE